MKVRSLHDGYEGWMTNTMLEPVEEDHANTMSAFVTTDILGTISAGGKKLNIPVGSSLPYFEHGKGKIAGAPYEFYGQYIKRDEQSPNVDLVKQHVMPWLNAPYLWGGRTPLGVDCSGLVQYVMHALDYSLPRTAREQATLGTPVPTDTAQLRAGDLLLFGKKGKVTHIGIYVGNGQFVHASTKAKRVVERPLLRKPAPGIIPWIGARRLIAMPDDSTLAPRSSQR